MISPSSRPRKLRAFAAVDGPGGSAPSTGGDAIVHIISTRPDLNFEMASRIRNALGDSLVANFFAPSLDVLHSFA